MYIWLSFLKKTHLWCCDTFLFITAYKFSEHPVMWYIFWTYCGDNTARTCNVCLRLKDKTWVETSAGRSHLGDVGVAGKIILKRIFRNKLWMDLSASGQALLTSTEMDLRVVQRTGMPWMNHFCLQRNNSGRNELRCCFSVFA